MRKLNDYRCNECSRIFEAFVAQGDIVHCPQCGGEDTVRVIRPPMVGGETPYKTLDKYGVPSQRIVSGPHYRSK